LSKGLKPTSNNDTLEKSLTEPDT